MLRQGWRKSWIGVFVLLIAMDYCHTLKAANYVTTHHEHEQYLVIYQDVDPSNGIEAPGDEDTFMEEVEQEFFDNEITLKAVHNNNVTSPHLKNVIAQVSFYPVYSSDPATLRVPTDTEMNVLLTSDPLSSISPMLKSPRLIGVLTSSSPAHDLVSGVLFYVVGRCDLAQPHFEKALSNEIDQINQHTIRQFQGACSIMAGKLAEGVEQLETIPRINSVGQFTGANLAWSYFQLDRQDEAFALLNEFIAEYSEYDTENQLSYLYSLRAQLHALNFDYDAALADMNMALELDTDNPALYVQRGQVYLLLYEWDRVMDDYNTALELDPEYADAYYYRGLLYYTTLVDRQNALPDFERYLELAPNGEHAEDAQNYAYAIRAELKALER